MIRIVLVEDEPFWRDAVQTMFSEYADLQIVKMLDSVDKARDFFATEHLHHQPIDLVLLDVTLGKETYGGIDLAYEFMLRRDEFRSMRWLMLTSYDQEELIAEFFAAGASNYLCKSNLNQVVRLIRDVFEERDALDQLPANALRKAFQKLREESDRRRLTGTEKTILSYIHQGNSILSISRIIHVAERTVKNHINRILRKLNVQSSKEAARLAVHRGWLLPSDSSDED